MNILTLDKPPHETRVVVAMSGGVDSSVCAALLAEQGFDVVGVTLQLYDMGDVTPRPGSCCAGRDIQDARRVAHKIGIPHYVLDYENRFKEAVIDEFADSYLRGETPIPCVKCNQTVKFQDLLGKAKELGADALITGHYVKRLMGKEGPELHRADDPVKDQSYFLFATTKPQLDLLHFPLGSLNKEETRQMARRFNLAIAAKQESQDICFVPDGDYAKVVEDMRPGAFKGGDIVHVDGRVLGAHCGIAHFTVGQRRGLGISAPEPLYVVRLEPKSAEVVVGPRKALLKSSLRIGGINWLGNGDSLKDNLDVEVKLRSTTPPVPATLSALGSGEAHVALYEPQIGVAPGQACVFYQGSRVLGGGWIKREVT